MNSIKQNIDNVLDSIIGFPIEEIEALIRDGEPAVEPLIQTIQENKHNEDLDLLPLIVTLGEIRSTKAVPALLDILTTPDMPIYAELAADAVAKLGSQACQPLVALIHQPGQHPEARFWTISALGMTGSASAAEPLRAALKTMPEFAGIIGGALAEIKDKDSIQNLYEIYRSLPNTNLWIPDIEESVQILAGTLEVRDDSRVKNWRLRWRRRPQWSWSPDISRHQIAHIYWTSYREGKLPHRKLNKKSLDQLLLKNTHPPKNNEEICSSCKQKVFKPTGLPVCPETAYFITIHQERLLQSFLNEKMQTIPLALDEMDWVILDEGKSWEKLPRKMKEEWLMDQMSLEFLLLQNCRKIQEGIAWLREIRQRLGDFWGLPQSELFDETIDETLLEKNVREETPSRKIGRNEPCLCGSGNKFKKCCGR